MVGNRSPADTPLMDAIRRFVEREDPGASVAPMVMPGFSDSHWWREAFPDCVAYGFFPQRAMDLFEALPARARQPTSACRSRTSAWPPPSTLISLQETLR